ncbi:MAG: DUF6108 family protein [Bacteroides sp.]|nr:DUF6108 family protein [Bacteroides sp.]
MKRLLTIMFALLALPIAVCAQSGLEINRIFGGKYSSDPTVTETLMSGRQSFLRDHKLTTFATFKGNAEKYVPIIQPLVLADGSHATGRNVRYRDGKLHYAFFILPPVTDNNKTINRYLYYLNNDKAGKPSVMVIYFEGTIKNSEAENLINALVKKR